MQNKLKRMKQKDCLINICSKKMEKIQLGVKINVKKSKHKPVKIEIDI